MVPTMVQFKVALSAPARYFKRLKQAVPVLSDGSVIVRRTQLMMESEIVFEGRRFLLFLPFDAEDIGKIVEFEAEARERSRGPLLENHILHEELMMKDALGNIHFLDVFMQELPSGMILRDAVNHYCATDLREAVCKMKARLDAIDCYHKNLNPSNVIICDSGVARPLRYWNAEWRSLANNDISQLIDLIDSYSNGELGNGLPCLLARDCEEEYIAEPIVAQDNIRCCCKGHRYGFIDADGRKITDYIYSSPSEFCERRAIVSKNNKMGVINTRGESVIAVVYKSIEFDVKSGVFIATNNSNCHIFDYNGKRITKRRVAQSDVESEKS